MSILRTMARTKTPRRVRVQKWTYEDASGNRRELEVFMQHIPVYGSDDRETIVQFNVALPDLDINEHHTDINELKKNVWAKLRERLTIRWEPWLLVTVECVAMSLTSDHIDTKSHLNIEIERWELGEGAGGKFSRQPYANTRTRNGWPETGVNIDSYSNRVQSVVSLLRDTPEHRAALESLLTALGLLHQKLYDLLAPAQIAATIAALQSASPPQLPGVLDTSEFRSV